MVDGPDGVKHIYPSLQGGEIWYLDPDNPDNRTEGESISGDQDEGFSAGDDAQVGIVTSSGDTDLDSDIDHGEVASRGYMANPNDWKDFEATTHWNYLDESSGGTSPSISIYGRGGHHSSPEPYCPGFKYSSEFETSGRHRFQKEQWHNEYAPAGAWKDVGLDDLTEHGWFGHKFICYNIDIGGGQLGVKLECWIDAEANNNWVKVDERLDDGGWGSAGDACGGEDDQIGTWGGPLVVLRIDSADVRFRNTSVRAISATGQFPPPGPPPPPGGGPTLQEVYNRGEGDRSKRLFEGPDDTWGPRAAHTVLSSGAPIFGRIIAKASFYFGKVGDPSGTASCKVWDSNNNVKATLGTLDVEDITEEAPDSDVAELFEFGGSTSISYPAIAVGDRIGVEFTGGDEDNYIRIGSHLNQADSTMMFVGFQGDPPTWRTGTEAGAGKLWAIVFPPGPPPPPGPPGPGPGPGPPPPSPPPSPPPGGGARISINSIHHYAIGTFIAPTCHGEAAPPPTDPPPPGPGTGITTQIKKFAAGYNILEFGETSAVGTSEND